MYTLNKVEDHVLSNKEADELRRRSWAGKKVKVVFAHDDTRKTTAMEVWASGRMIAADFRLKK